MLISIDEKIRKQINVNKLLEYNEVCVKSRNKTKKARFDTKTNKICKKKYPFKF